MENKVYRSATQEQAKEVVQDDHIKKKKPGNSKAIPNKRNGFSTLLRFSDILMA